MATPPRARVALPPHHHLRSSCPLHLKAEGELRVPLSQCVSGQLYVTMAAAVAFVVAPSVSPAARLPVNRRTAPRRPPPRASVRGNTPRANNLQVVLDRLSDTLLDARIHYSRLFSSESVSNVDAPRVVILGTGWAAHSLIKIIDHTRLRSVTIVSPRNFFFFTPLLTATAVGTVEFRSIVEPIRKANPFVNYYEAYAVDVDPHNKLVHCVQGRRENEPAPNASRFQLPYDVLVVATGEKTTTFGVDAADQYAYFLKEISDARLLRSKILDTLERAMLPVWTEEQRRHMLHIVVVGGGPTGCEFAGELSDFVQNDLAPRYGKRLVSEIRVTLLQSGKSLLTQFETSLQQLALKSFRDRVNVQFDARVTDVTDSQVLLQDGSSVDYGILVWAAGNGTRPIVSTLLRSIEQLRQGDESAPPLSRRKLPVDSWMRVVGLDNVFALGDCAQMIDGALPSTAQVAGQQGAFLGRELSFFSFCLLLLACCS